MSMITPTTTATIIPRRSIGTFHATVTIEESATDELEITQHPVQQGATITDHAFLKPASVNIKIMFNNADAPLAETYSKLRQLQASREPFDVVTGKRAYKNMLIKSLGQTNDAQTENVLSISLELLEIIITRVETTTVPPRKRHKKPGKTGKTEKAGNKSAKPVDANSSRGKSALRTLLGK